MWPRQSPGLVGQGLLRFARNDDRQSDCETAISGGNRRMALSIFDDKSRQPNSDLAKEANDTL